MYNFFRDHSKKPSIMESNLFEDNITDRPRARGMCSRAGRHNYVMLVMYYKMV